MPVADRAVRASAEFESILADVFRKAGWRVHRPSSVRDMGVDLVLDANEKRYVVQLKVSSEGRRDRLIPLLSQAILQARAFAQHFPEPAVPIAVVAAKHIPASVAEQIKQFAERYAPEVGVGVIDAEGFRSFAGPDLEGLDAKPSRRVARHIALPQRLPDLFSDLNQWMLKILLGQHLPEPLISVPREHLRNASQLAEAANVSVMSASRLVNQLAKEGFLDEHGERLQIVRVDELLERWVSANRQMARDIPARWIIKKDEKQFLASVAKYAGESKADPALKSKARSRRVMKAPPRCCIGLFAAADALGVGFVRGVPPHLYLERLDLDVLQKLGLSIEDADRRADVYVRVPSNKEAIFRAAVIRDGLPVSDALQVWLDASAHRARGREQADEIRRSVLNPLFGKQR
jgi:Restriction endonuclease